MLRGGIPVAKRKPLTFTAVSYVVDRAKGETRRREEIVFEQAASPKGAYRFRPVGRKAFLPEAEQKECDEVMLRRAGSVLNTR